MYFTPSRIEVKRGEQIRFVIRNVGTENHEFLLATTEETLKHAELLKKFPRTGALPPATKPTVQNRRRRRMLVVKYRGNDHECPAWRL
jgi:uncharacterized cupredoxin-like copper-binding protein